MRREQHAAEPGPGVLEQHALVQHGELEVRVRVVHRNAAGLGREQHEHRREAEEVGRVPGEDPRRPAMRGEGAEVGRAGRHRDREHDHHQDRLDQRRDRHLARGAHAAERAAGVERADRREEARQREQAEEHHRVAQRKGRRPRPDDRHERARGHRGGQHQHRDRPEEARGGVRLHRALAQQLDEVAVGLEDPGALPALEPRLELLDEAGDQRPEQHEQRHLEEHERRAVCSPVIVGPPRTAAAPRRGHRARTRCSRGCGRCCGRGWRASSAVMPSLDAVVDLRLGEVHHLAGVADAPERRTACPAVSRITSRRGR